MQFFNYLEGVNLYPVFFLATGVIFACSWLIEPRRLMNGVFFSFWVLATGCWLADSIWASRNQLLTSIFQILLILILIGVMLLLIFSWAFLLWNAYFVWKYEAHTLPNMLSLILGLCLLIAGIIVWLRPVEHLPWLHWLLLPLPTIILYLLFVFYIFLVDLLLCQFIPRTYHQDYLVVLGAGLIHGKYVSPLLAARIDRAIRFASKQAKKTGKMPKFIMSGGRGSDEALSEAAAMAQYAAERGIPPTKILLEDQSTNTRENMLFSKHLAEQDCQQANFRAKFFTNNYHVLRAGLYAKQVHFHANGVGAKTRLYYLPNAIIREFAATLLMFKKWHLAVIIILIAVIIAQALASSFGLPF